MLFVKPDMKYTDMAIYIDKTVAKGKDNLTEQEENTVFEYLYHLCFMLAHRGKYFNTADKYDEFAAFFAANVYNRLLTHPKLTTLGDDGEPLLPPIKSCLNYLKSTIYAQKVDWEQENYCQAFSTNTLAEEMMQSNYLVLSQVQATVEPTLKIDLDNYLKSIPKVIESFVRERFHERNNHVLYKNICISCLLSVINSISFTYKEMHNLETKYTTVDARQHYLDKCYENSRGKCIILYRVPKGYRNLVTIYVREILTLISKELRELSNVTFTMPDSALFDIAVTEIGGVLTSEY